MVQNIKNTSKVRILEHQYSMLYVHMYQASDPMKMNKPYQQ